ncbi:MAG: carboxypeptidase regulatory-like domain-containing protein [Phycisphaerales bacterium]|nr:MAG: carboxypeptidase regulatory-like domain-containing protein [Phycisphaerales bacterium]
MRISIVLVCIAVVPGGVRQAGAQTYPAYSEIGPILLATENAYPAICQRHDLGLSVQGRNLWAIQISDNIGVEEDEPEFKYVAAMHGNEIVGLQMCMMLIEYLTTNYGTNPQATRLVDEVDIWIVPLMNPDGYDRVPRIRYNVNGVDLNRDFPDTITSPNNTTAGRQAETAVIMNWSFGESFIASANFHGGALVINYPYDGRPDGGYGSGVYIACPDDDLFIYMSEEYSRYNLPMWNSSTFFHGITNGAYWYTIYGGMHDWNYRYMGCNEVTAEIGVVKEPPASEIPQYWNENRDSMLAYMETCLIGVRGLVFDASNGLPMAATVRVVGRDHEVYTDPDIGDYHRMLMPGTYDLTFEAAGYAPITEYGVVVAAGDATRLDVVFGATPAVVVSPNGGESLTAGVPTTVTWTGSPLNEFHVQYTENYGAIVITSDDFDSGVLGPEYTTGGDRDWSITASSSHSAPYSARAGSIDHAQQSWLKRTVDGGNLSFWYSVSCEANFDIFRFFVDGEEKLSDSGNSGWTYYSLVLPPGGHELEWRYTKDGSVSFYDDTVYIDDLAIESDTTVWSDIIALTPPGAASTPWTPVNPGSDYKVRVRAHYGNGLYGAWDESDATFDVTGPVVPDGDYDGDGDVDLADCGGFQLCFQGPATGPCGAFEFVVDGGIDLADYPGFEALLVGP